MIITRTPFRISIGGGGTDLPFYCKKHGGSLISAGIDKYMYIALRQRFYRETRLAYSKIEIVKNNRDIQHPLIREALKLLDINEGMEIVSISDVPSGTGLGSSGAFLVGLLNALHTYQGDIVSKKVLAEEAAKIEIGILKEPVGKQDPYATAYGGIIHMAINKQGLVKVSPLNLTDKTIRELEENLLLFYTSIRRKTVDVITAQKNAVESDEERMVYLTKIKEIGNEIKSALEKGNTNRFGKWMNVHWETKKQQTSAISNPQIDRWYELALQNGALGGKIIGAGGGGFFMFYVEGDKEKFRQEMIRAHLVEMPFRFDFDGTKVIFNSR